MTINRRNFLRTGGALVIAFSLPLASRALAAVAPGTKSMNKSEVDAWLVLGKDGTVTVYTGKVDLGTGVRTALMQMMADELEVPFEKIEMVMGDTALTVDQGQTAGSLTIHMAGAQLRQAAATARKTLLDAAAIRFDVPTGELQIVGGIVSVKSDPAKRVAYADLVTDKGFVTKLDDKAPLKDPRTFKYVGKSMPRVDIPAKVTGTYTYMQDFRVPDMLHARVIHPTAVGAQLLNYDEASVRDVPGFVKVVRKHNFLAVICKTEWGAVTAAQKLKADWSKGTGLPDQARLYEFWRNAPVAKTDVVTRVGDAKAALGSAKKTLKATYDFTIHTHGSIGPACAIADFRDGKCMVWSASQATHSLQSEISSVLGIPKQNIRLMYLDGSGCYGRNGHEDCSAEAALASQLAGAPVRLQWMRHDEHGWDPKSPPTLVDMQGGLDAVGNVVAWDANYLIAAQSGTLDDFPLLAATLSGVERKGAYTGNLQQNAAAPYAFPANLTSVHRMNSPVLRTSHVRTPGRMQNTFATESFMDELAYAAGADPLQFRLRYLSDPRAHAVLSGAARLAGWQTRAVPNAGAGKDKLMRGRGISYVRYDGDRTYVAVVAEVEIDRSTGHIRVARMNVSHDCGQIINPDGTRNQIEGGVIQTVSRTLMEEIKFDRERVTSTDWASYPILKFPDIPEVHVDLIDRPGERAWGAGEMAPTVVPSAIANAIFDASGVRMRSVPFTPDKMLAAIKQKNKRA
ncbi:MAG TPA: molybdopterin cofactor-binding domain-containing protein [Burkholderiaceae bacterium]|nr:molybdopterin cofactor-binding domain-containing protein [Burkholderiaceae bacterium]